MYMQTIDGLLKRKKPAKKEGKKLKYQFQDISLDLIKKFNVQGKYKLVMFGFIKNKINKGQWWKIKEIVQYMDSKEITSMNYFMACFRKKMNIDKAKQTVDSIIKLWNSRNYKKKQYAINKLQMSKWFLKPATYNFLADKMGVARVPVGNDSVTKKVEDQNILKEAQDLFGGKILN